jgi:hypothetical protein
MVTSLPAESVKSTDAGLASVVDTLWTLGLQLTRRLRTTKADRNTLPDELFLLINRLYDIITFLTVSPTIALVHIKNK